MDAPLQTSNGEVGPVIAKGTGFTVTFAAMEQPERAV
jgi:hypothetical protein